MAKLGLRQLELHLSEAADILGSRTDAIERCRRVLSVLFLKRCSDRFDEMREQAAGERRAEGGAPQSPYQDVFFVPEWARWPFIVSRSHERGAEDLFERALVDLMERNSALRDALEPIGFAWRTGGTGVSDREIRRLVDHFDRYRLRNDDLEFPDLLGAACEYLIGTLADKDRMRGGEFHTPVSVVRMMNRLVKPQQGMRVYDPCSGSGGMLVHAREYVDEQGQDARDLFFYGQEDNRGSWAVSKLNMTLHNVLDADIRHGDTLTSPRHVQGSELMRFDRVLTSPPFSRRHDLADLWHRDQRFRYGHTSASDLMFVQHVLAVLTPTGLGAMLAPHGVLFRGGAEKMIRRGILEEDHLEAVIGLPPGLLHVTSAPTCVLILRGSARREEERRGKVLFVNADREYTSVRWRNHLAPRHVEKIVSAFEDYRDIPGFARVVDIEELRENDFNLDIRRYVDNTPSPEPQDVHAHLEGGMPRAEVTARTDLLASYGIGPLDLFMERKRGHGPYLDFLPEGQRPGPDRLAELARPREDALWQAFEEGWTILARRLVDLAGPPGQDMGRSSGERRSALMRTRGELTSIFAGAAAAGPLDRHAVADAIAEWWAENKHRLLAVAEHGFASAAEQNVVLQTLRESLRGGLNDFVMRRRGELIETYRGWEKKYALSFREIELRLTGAAVSPSLYGQWSRQEPWDFADSGTHRVGVRHRVGRRIHAVIDTEKDIEAEIAKLDIDRQTVLLPLVSPMSGSSWKCERVPLGEVVKSIRYGAIGPLSLDVHGLPVVRASNFSDGEMDLGSLRYRTKPAAERDLLCEGDVLLDVMGKGTSVWHGDLPEATFSNDVMRLTVDDQRLLPGYLAEWLRHAVTHDRADSFTTPSPFSRQLSVERLRDLDIDLPEMDAQHRVVSEITEISRKLSGRRVQLAKLRLIKQTLLGDLRKGRMSVTYVD
ncbi:N-6 DNA methylase [Streptosporangium sandarakinum]|uniref:N-6 DNA methylase n=1 Tax=Streptosporangium sandarakinum TaxID=1260955 RepID=UPI0037B4F538